MKLVYHCVLLMCVQLCCLVQNASSIFCYDCNSAYDPRCGEEFDPFSLGIVNCSLRDPPEHIAPVEPTICRTIKMDINGKVRIVRQCGYLKDPEVGQASCRRLVGVGELFVTYCTCDSDLCNSGSQHRQETALILVILFLVLKV